MLGKYIKSISLVKIPVVVVAKVLCLAINPPVPLHIKTNLATEINTPEWWDL